MFGLFRIFGWFRKHVRKIGIFGVEVEFHPPTDTAPPLMEPANTSIRDWEKQPQSSLPVASPQMVSKPPTQQEKSMALRKCPEPDCGNMVSTMAEKCPHCGHPLKAVGVPDHGTADQAPTRQSVPPLSPLCSLRTKEQSLSRPSSALDLSFSRFGKVKRPRSVSSR